MDNNPSNSKRPKLDNTPNSNGSAAVVLGGGLPPGFSAGGMSGNSSMMPHTGLGGFSGLPAGLSIGSASRPPETPPSGAARAIGPHVVVSPSAIGSGMGGNLNGSVLGSPLGGSIMPSMGTTHVSPLMSPTLKSSTSGLNDQQNYLHHQQMQQYNAYLGKVASVTATLTYATRIMTDLSTLMQHLERDVSALSQLENTLRQHVPPPPSMLSQHTLSATFPNPPYQPVQNPMPAAPKVSQPPTTRAYKVTQMDEQQLLASKLEDFEFMEILGTGTFGKVRLCKHKATKKHFCMKILNKARIHRLKQTEHIHNEKNVLRQINHPFIVRLFNSFKDSKSLYLLLEFIPGGELFNYIRRSGKLTSEVSRLYAAEIVLALEHLHSKRILYRDLKPENILIDETGHVKLTDFGFSKYVPTDRTMSMCGTPEYIAPEIIHNNGHGKAVDWWSLGILIFEMLAGYPPFSDEPNKTIFEKIPTEKVEFPEPFDAEAKDLIEKLLVVDPSRRLGCRSGPNGAEEIKSHPWFKSIDWISVMTKSKAGPVNPGITRDGDTHNFYKYSDVNLNEELTTDDKTNLDEIFADF